MRICTLLCFALAACSTERGAVDAAPSPDADLSTRCPSPAARATTSATVSGTVIDWVTAAPIAGATVDLGTAWDNTLAYLQLCATLAHWTTDRAGQVGPATVDLGPRDPPIAIFLVSGDLVGATASDQTLSCGDTGCADLNHSIPTPSAALAASWRGELAAGGMPEAESTGLILFVFREADGSPAAGVVPTFQGFDPNDHPAVLEPDRAVRFLAPDRATLAPLGTRATTASGAALIRIERDSGFVSGDRDAARWIGTGVLALPGWIFVEDRSVSS